MHTCTRTQFKDTKKRPKTQKLDINMIHTPIPPPGESSSPSHLPNQFDNLRSNSLVDPKRRVQTIEPEIPVHAHPTTGIEARGLGRAIHIRLAVRSGVFIRTRLWVSAGMVEDAGKEFVRVKDKGRDVFVSVAEGVR